MTSISVQKTGPGGYGLFVDSEIDGRSTRAEFEVMLWSDLVRASMRSGILATYGLMSPRRVMAVPSRL